MENLKNVYKTFCYGWKYDRKGFWDLIFNALIIVSCICYSIFILKYLK